MRISGLDHLLFRAENLAKTLAFYREGLGLACEVAGSDASPSRVRVVLGAGVALVFTGENGDAPTGPPYPSLALSLQVEDPDAFAETLQARGLKIEQSPHDTPNETRRFTAFDPDGLRLHFERPIERQRR